MLREHARSVEKIMIFFDLSIVAVSMLLANKIAGSSGFVSFLGKYSFVAVLACAIWFLFLRFAGFYHSLRTIRYLDLLKKIVQVAVGAGVANAAILFLVAPGFDRVVYGLHLVIAIVGLLSWKLLIRYTQKRVRRRGLNFRRVLVVGTGDRAERFIRHLEEHRDWGFEVVGCIQSADTPPKDVFAGYPVLGRMDILIDACKSQPIDEVIFSLPVNALQEIEEMLPRLEAMGVAVRMSLDYYRPKKCRTLVGCLGEDDPLPVVTYYRASLDPTQLVLKRFLDVIGAVVGLTFTGLAMPFLWLAIKLDSPGPMFFRQKRVGRNGRLFTCYKFRTMGVDAEERKAALMGQNEMSGAVFKIQHDPRITRVGRFLRKTSLDEFPQFWNVFKGDMSLVGTRPPTPEEVAQYEEWQRGRICIKPGLTGLWQTSGRNKISDFDEICKLDLDYVDNWSIWLDMKLLCKTFGVVLLGVGAR